MPATNRTSMDIDRKTQREQGSYNTTTSCKTALLIEQKQHKSIQLARSKRRWDKYVVLFVRIVIHIESKNASKPGQGRSTFRAFAFFRSPKSSLGIINTSILAPSLWRWDSTPLSPITTLVFRRLRLKSLPMRTLFNPSTKFAILSLSLELLNIQSNSCVTSIAPCQHQLEYFSD